MIISWFFCFSLVLLALLYPSATTFIQPQEMKLLYLFAWAAISFVVVLIFVVLLQMGRAFYYTNQAEASFKAGNYLLSQNLAQKAIDASPWLKKGYFWLAESYFFQ